jgi:hypothetical protein
MQRLNGRLETEVATRDPERLKLIDLYAWQNDRYDDEDNLLFGDYEIPRDSKASEEQLTPSDTDIADQASCDSLGRCATLEYALNIICHDLPGGHPSTLMQGLVANELLEAVNPWLDSPAALLTDEEILDAAVVPEPNSTLMLGSALGVLALLRSVAAKRRAGYAA